MNWIVDGILPTGLTLLCGAPKIGKSWLSLKLCLCVSRGVDLWGLKTRHCKTLYCCPEDTPKRIRKRHDILEETASELQDTEPSSELEFMFECPGVDDGLIEPLERYIVENPGFKLIVIDSAQMPPINGSPNYSNIAALKRIADKYGISVVLVCRTTAKATDQIGTSDLAADAMMILSRKNRGDGKGNLIFTGLCDGKIELEFCDGDWRLQ